MGKHVDWDKIAELADKIREQGLSLADGAKEFGIPVRRLYQLSRRRHKPIAGSVDGRRKAAAEAVDGTEPGPVQTQASISRTTGFELSPLPEQVQRLIIGYRKEHPEAGFKRIEDQLKGEHLVVVSRKQIRHVLKVHGLLEGHDSSFDAPAKPAKGSRRFEASCAGEMYQMDVTYVYLTGIPVLYLVVIVDDHSRFCVGAQLCHDQKGETLIGVLHDSCSAPRETAQAVDRPGQRVLHLERAPDAVSAVSGRAGHRAHRGRASQPAEPGQGGAFDSDHQGRVPRAGAI